MDVSEDTAQRPFRQYLAKAVQADGQPDLAAIGVVGLNLPLAAGGLELGEGSLAIAFEELGAALVSSHLLGTLLAADCIVRAGPRSPRFPALAAIREGRLTVAALGPVDAAPPATHVLLHRTQTRQLALVPATLVGDDVTSSPTDGGNSTSSPATDELLVPPDGLQPVWEWALRRARLHQAAYLTGLAAGAWERTAEYVRTRRQFGSPLVDNQAVAFPMAALAARLEATRLAVQHAAWTEDTGADDASTGTEDASADEASLGQTGLATQALCLAAELALDTTRLGMHLHGARGLLRSSPIQRYYRRAMVEAVRLGRTASLWRELGARRLAGTVDVVDAVGAVE